MKTETSSELTGSPHTLVHLDAIRGAAALLVCLVHMKGLYFPSPDTGQPGALSSQPAAAHILLGDQAVMIFFVLSGYLVGGSVLKSVQRGTWSWSTYLTKRLTRLWIVLLPALLLGVTLDYIGLHHFSHSTDIYAGPPHQTEVHDVRSALTPSIITANALFLQTIFTSTAGTNNALWSLANEFWYYIAFPFFALALHKGTPKRMRVISFVLLNILLYCIRGPMALLFLVWLMGAFINLLPPLAKITRLKGMLLAVFSAFSLLFVLLRRIPLSKIAAEFVIASAFTLLLFVIVHQAKQSTGRTLYSQIAGFFSNMSYSLYLFHLPMAVFLCALVNRPWHPWQKTPHAMAVFSLCLLGILFLSYLLYLAFERNTEKLRKFLAQSFRRPSIAQIRS